MKRFVALVLMALFAVSLAACDRVSQSALDLVVGDCFKVPEGDTISDVQRSPCNEAHSGEVFFVADFPSQDTYPTEEAFSAWVDQNCTGATFQEFTGRAYDDVQDIDYSFFYPTADGWKDGDREMTCILVPVGQDEVSASFRKAPAAS